MVPVRDRGLASLITTLDLLDLLLVDTMSRPQGLTIQQDTQASLVALELALPRG